MSQMKFLRFTELAARGIPFSRQHIHRLVAAGRFPKPVKIGEATNGFIEAEIDNWCAAKIAERDGDRPIPDLSGPHVSPSTKKQTPVRR
jgi:prophage regulatory protein